MCSFRRETTQLTLTHPVITLLGILTQGGEKKKKKKKGSNHDCQTVAPTDTDTFFLCYSLLIAHVDSANAYLTSKNVILMMVEGAGFLQVVVMETAAAA